MSKKYYAVIKGRTPGIFNNWSETEKSVSGYSGAIFKSFGTLQEAQEYLNGTNGVPAVLTGVGAVITGTAGTAGTAVQIFTDGSHSQGRGGIGIVFIYNDQIINQYGLKIEEFPTTNIRAELYAILVALRIVSGSEYKGAIEIHTDSEYSVNVFNSWIYTWIKNNWKISTGEPVANVDLIINIRQLLDQLRTIGTPVTLHWVRAHADNYYNNVADGLAKQGRDL